MADLQARLDLPPEDAVRFFAAKGDAIAWDYTDVWRETNVHAFTVAKATNIEVLRTIRAEVAKAIGDGQTFQDFKRTLQPRLQDLGWWGKKEVLDGDTGEVTKAQLGSVRRLRTIYQTNVQTAYMAGRYKRYLDNVDNRPYWRYVAIMDGRTRPAHAALHGKVWRWDDPIWAVIWPPNGWGCRCRIVALTEAEFQTLGQPLEIGKDAIVQLQVPIGNSGQTVAVQGVRYTDETGRQKIFRPDPGWDYNPGAAWSRFDPGGFAGEHGQAAPALPAAPAPKPGAAAVPPPPALRTWQDTGRPDLRAPGVPVLPNPGLLPAAPDLDTGRRIVQEALLPAGQPLRTVATPVEDVVIRPEWLLPMSEPPKGPAGRSFGQFAPLVVPTLEQPFEVWLTPYADGSYRKRYLALFKGAADLLVMLVRENRDGSLAWEAYGAAEFGWINSLRRGTLLYGQDIGGA